MFGVLPGTVGTIQATEVIKLILGFGEPLIGKLLLYDAGDMSFQTIHLQKNPRCKVCGENPSVTHLIDYEQFCGVPTRGHAQVEDVEEVTVSELSARLRQGASLILLDVREAVEQQVSHLPDARLIPLGQLPTRLTELDRGAEIIAFCRTGVRSAQAVGVLRAAGFQRARSLRGGINAWVREIDPGMYEY